MGIRERTRASGNVVFEAEIRIADVKPSRATFNDIETAKAWVAQVEGVIKKTLQANTVCKTTDTAKPSGERAYGRAKLANVITDYLESAKCSNRGRQALRPAAGYVGKVTVGEADEIWLEKYVARMRSSESPRGKPYTYSTLHGQIVYMALALEWWAKKNNVLNPDICISTKKFPADWDVRRSRRLENGEHERLLAQMNMLTIGAGHWRCLYELCLETGARLQELSKSEWCEMERDDRIWRIPSAHTKKRKTRRVPLSSRAREIIAQLRDMAKPGESRVFHVLRTPHYLSSQFSFFVKMAGIVDLRFHDLRHEAISRMCINKRNVPIKTIMEIVGHETYEAFTRYSHARDDELIDMFE
jgi:integrase